MVSLQTRANWPAIFTAFCSGTSLDELADVWNIPAPELKRVARDQEWAALAARLPLPAPAKVSSPDTAKRLRAIEANRQRWLGIYENLLQDAERVVRGVRDETLKLEKVLAYKGDVTHADYLPGFTDRQALGAYLKTLQEIGCRALGDVSPKELASDGPDRASVAGGITIVLPAIVTVPPNVVDRAKPATAEPSPVVDIEAQRASVEGRLVTPDGAASATPSATKDF